MSLEFEYDTVNGETVTITFEENGNWFSYPIRKSKLDEYDKNKIIEEISDQLELQDEFHD